ncbi:MAG: hypothetical protein K8R45_13525, partial [Desulfobacterales bacterium]|nr:hypothetical protein [Desulfobacterales bacterium]
MDTYLKKEMQEVRLLDHATGFREKVIPVEIRTDIFTDSTTRILKFRWRPPETAKDLSFIEKSRETCPFCPERMSTSTPKFPASIVKEGQILYGRATVLPNAFPYSLYSGVIIFSEDHYVPLDQFTSEVLFDSLMAGTVYIKRIQETDHSVAYASINWNYMPPAGGGIVHPHLQVVVNEKPTRFHSRLLAASLRYKKSRGRNYWKDLISFEQNKAERYLYRYGDVVFLTSFCTGGMFGEVLTLFDESACLQDVTED